MAPLENKEEIRTKDFNYHLPDEAIARHPLENRDFSRLLVCKGGEISHHRFFDLPSHLPEKSLLVFNNTRVIPARLHFQKSTGTWIELLIIKEIVDGSVVLSSNQKLVEVMVGNKRKWKKDEVLKLESVDSAVGLEASWFQPESNRVIITWWPQNQLFYGVLAQLGEMPIPPYLNREAEERDKQDYQTIYACEPGAIAAPTAGLHFTERVMADLQKLGFQKLEITLHVGLGTFKPMKSEKVADHEMHAEEVIISREVIGHLAQPDEMILAVGTTSLRSLESLFWIALLAKRTGRFHEILETPVPYEWEQANEGASEVFAWLFEEMSQSGREEIRFFTRLFVMPGYQFRVVKGLITNFHQPESTLLVLISAFLGEKWKKVYSEALNHDYRFLSYGDSSLLIP